VDFLPRGGVGEHGEVHRCVAGWRIGQQYRSLLLGRLLIRSHNLILWGIRSMGFGVFLLLHLIVLCLGADLGLCSDTGLLCICWRRLCCFWLPGGDMDCRTCRRRASIARGWDMHIIVFVFVSVFFIVMSLIAFVVCWGEIARRRRIN
jgi:hypothetical protein